MSSKNPYIVGNAVGNSPAFVGRTDILQKVLAVVRDAQQNSIVLYGQRRIGKTSVLQELQAQLSQLGNYHPVFFDLQDKAQWNLGRVIGNLADKIAEQLNLTSPNLGTDPETHFRQNWLPKILNTLPIDTSLVLLFDEFDVLANPESEQAGSAFFPYLHDLLTVHLKHLNAVFAIGRNIEDLTSIAWALFKDVATSQPVSLLNYEDTVKLIRLSEDSLNWSNNDVIDKIWQLTSGHPFLTQSLCYGIWERLCYEKLDKPPTVTLVDVEAAISDTLNARRNQLEWLWEGLQSAERVVASTLASAGAEIITEAQLYELLRQSGVPIIIRELQHAPRLLQDWDLIEPVAGGFRFRVELLRYWIAENKKPHKIHVELDHLDPAADILYQAGQKLYQAHHWNTAKVPLRQTINLNAHHVGASLLLADILLKQKQLKEALEILEKIYTFRPIAARTALIEALLTSAQTTERIKEKLKYYQRILDIEPEHPEAIKLKQELEWQREAKRWKPAKLAKQFVATYRKRIYQATALIVCLVFSYWIAEDLPSIILLEIEQSDNSHYSLIGVPSSENYLLESMHIMVLDAIAPQGPPSFEYQHYKSAQLTIVPNTKTITYQVNTELLQNQLQQQIVFQYPYSKQEKLGSFTFDIQFPKDSQSQIDFACQAITTKQERVDCKVKQKGYYSLLHGIPWWGMSILLFMILSIMIEIVFAFKNREPDDVL
jgi:tetratricopeptide (TPR) repeat protein